MNNIPCWQIPRIYSASKIWHAEKWLTLRNKGFNIISTWIDIPCGTPENKGAAKKLTENEKANLWNNQVIPEILASDLLIIYSEPGEVQNGGIAEMIHALSWGKPVFTIGLADNMRPSANSDCAYMRQRGIFDATILGASIEVQYRNAVSHYYYEHKKVA